MRHRDLAESKVAEPPFPLLRNDVENPLPRLWQRAAAAGRVAVTRCDDERCENLGFDPLDDPIRKILFWRPQF